MLQLRARYNMFANFRPVKLPRSLLSFSPLKLERVSSGLDIMIIRELCGGIYFGKKYVGKTEEGHSYASDVMEYAESQVEQIARVAFKEAEKKQSKLHNIHKSNVLACSVFWNDIIDRVHLTEFPNVLLEHMLVDNAAYQLVINPCQFQVMLMENMMGDILSDEAAGLIGSLGLMPSACIGPKKSCFEPAHGSAPSIAGKNQANPYSMIGSIALMMEKAFSLQDEADDIWHALFEVLSGGYYTMDLKDNPNANKTIVSTREFGSLVKESILG
ncbi:MAG: 3-isopropylmalate dehydrogenase [Candidatus Diapherotrites archaeon CG08_land_8_20_14_0_20_34_12]|nr:MAG: 3-isopropylmalate dehydrogenase [Candidatus Diapherotrites archaeon CG08_land_8_20_14_0_20_34_12]